MALNEIALGDAYELIKGIPDKSVDLVITDPPYEYDSLSNAGIFGKRSVYDELIENGIDKGFDLSLLDELVRTMKKINMYVWVSKKQFYKVMSHMVEKYKCKWDLIVWHKKNALPLCNKQYLHDCEYCLYFREDRLKLNTKYERAKTVYSTFINVADKEKYGHPTCKPEEIIENFIKNSCPEGGGRVRPVPRLGDDLRLREKARVWIRGLRDKPEVVRGGESEAGGIRCQRADEPPGFRWLGS